MANFSTDEDLLKMEPELFRVHYHHSQEIAYGTDGVIKHSDSAVIFSSATGDFVHGGVASGHVMWLAKSSDSVLYYDAAYPVKSLATSTSVLLEAKATPAVPTASSITYRISTFDPQHEDAHFLLMDMNEIDDDDLNTQNDEADLYNRRQLREAFGWAAQGQQALVLVGGPVTWTGPNCFSFAHVRGYLLDQDTLRLVATANALGVRRVKVHHPETERPRGASLSKTPSRE